MDTPTPRPGPWGKSGLEAPTAGEIERQALTPEATAKLDKVARSFQPVDFKRLTAGVKAAGRAVGEFSHVRALIIIGLGHNNDGSLCAASHVEGTFSTDFYRACTQDLPHLLGALIARSDIIERGLKKDDGPKPPLPPQPSWLARQWYRLFHRHAA